MSRSIGFLAFAAILALIALAYFTFIAARPAAFARVLLHRGYEAKGWTEQRLATRVRLLGTLGAGLALAGIVLAIVKIVG
jgi:hypothetical protein